VSTDSRRDLLDDRPSDLLIERLERDGANDGVPAPARTFFDACCALDE
jgi:hypothetical protein